MGTLKCDVDAEVRWSTLKCDGSFAEMRWFSVTFSNTTLFKTNGFAGRRIRFVDKSLMRTQERQQDEKNHSSLEQF